MNSLTVYYLLLFSIDPGFISPFDLCFPMVDHETTPLLLSEEKNGHSTSRTRLSIPHSFQCFIYGIGRLGISTPMLKYIGGQNQNMQLQMPEGSGASMEKHRSSGNIWYAQCSGIATELADHVSLNQKVQGRPEDVFHLQEKCAQGIFR